MNFLIFNLLVCVLLYTTFYLAPYQCEDKLEDLTDESVNFYQSNKRKFTELLAQKDKEEIQVSPRHVLFLLFDSLKPVLNLFVSLIPIFNIVFLTRAIHFMIDVLVPINSKWNSRITNLSTSLLGFYLIYDHHERTLMVTITAVFLTFGQLDLLRYEPGKNLTPILVVAGLLAIAPICLNEYLIHYVGLIRKSRHRSILMVLAMKFLTLVINTTTIEPSRSLPEPSPLDKALQNLAYFVHPTSCLIPHWHRPDLSENKARYKTLTLVMMQLKKCSVTLVLAFMIFGLTQILTDASIFIKQLQDSPTPTAMHIYLSALQFRLSHYFMCHLTLSLLSLFSTRLDEITCKILPIELPRSMVDVVVCWHLPMHCWLKNYVFRPAKRELGSATLALALTYSVSALLHGFKFHIWSVILTLGHLTWVEYKLREKLAEKLSACVLARKCSYKRLKCKSKHLRTEHNSYLTELINIGFSVMAMMHLAYLGCVFTGESEKASYMDALNQWSQLNFYSHLMAVITHIVYFILLILP